MLHFLPTTLASALEPALSGDAWDAFVASAKTAVTTLSGARHMLIALCVLVVLYINLRLARWISDSIRFEPHHHHATHTKHSQHHRTH